MPTILLLIAAVIGPPQFDPEVTWSVYTIRGGPQPANVPLHFWAREELHRELCWDGQHPWAWQLYRLQGAPPFRATEESPFGTWVPKELDTPERRAMRRKVGLTNYEIYEAPQLVTKGQQP